MFVFWKDLEIEVETISGTCYGLFRILQSADDRVNFPFRWLAETPLT